jgi:hypothetical protein
MAMQAFHHPLPLGTKILSVRGECDEMKAGVIRETGPNAVGEIVSAYQSDVLKVWFYGVVFGPSRVRVHMDEKYELDGKNPGYQLVSYP